MSDDGIEQAFEEDLKAGAERLVLTVGGHLRAVDFDTPQGRERLERMALRYAETSEDVVVRKGAGEPIEAQTGSTRPVPVPLRTPTGCCLPKPYAGPSGVRLRHAWNCTRSPGEVFHSPVVDISRARLQRKHLIETRRTGLDDAIAAHPAKGTLTVEGHKWWHPGEDALDCIECSERGD